LPSVFDIPNLRGFNVTVPYKKAIIPLLDSCSSEAMAIGAVNTVSFENGKWVGYNTDVFGFEKSFLPLMSGVARQVSALVFGTGGASVAVQYVLKKHSIPFVVVGRGDYGNDYEKLNSVIMKQNNIFINTTPVGMYPNTDEVLPIPYDGITAGAIAFDLIYNPDETRFLSEAHKRGAVTKNGLEMLHLQAEAAWDIFMAVISPNIS
jgi:shikimate dehydrogenase